MLVGLLLTSVFEPYISGRYFGLESISVGTLVGSTTFLLCLFYVAYKKTKEDYLNLSIESARSNLHILNNQMQPHFLFNSLNSLVELIESNNECAAQVAQNLADLYRQILKNSKNQVSSLESEISIINKYLELEKIRYEGRFSYNIVISIDILNSNEIQNIYLPSLILQTLVENAIKHGISKSLKGGEILIQVFRNEKLGFHISVTNSGCPFQYSNSKGTGLANTEARLSLLYGTKHNFIIESVDQKTIASFWFSGDAVGI
jgi:LytS/YehU family sensor histidine kinase